MFKEAVANYEKSKPTFASKGSSQTNIQKAFKSSQQPGDSRNNRLQPSGVDSFTIPKERLPSPRPIKSYKPPSEEGAELFRALYNENAFQENASFIDGHNTHTNLMPGLHEALPFDDYGSDNGSESLFAFDEIQLPPDVEAVLAGNSTGLKPQQSQEPPLPQADIPDSSAPLPWSSSPVPYPETMAAPKPPIGKALPRESVSYMRNMTMNKNVAASRPAQERLKAEGKPKRQLPWTDKTYCKEEPDTKKPRGRKPKLSHTVIDAPQKNPDMLWNATASQVKDAQKKLKADTRKKASSPARRGVKKGSKATSLKLSEEQLNVIQLAVEGEKSVFFTGSAGTGKSVLLRELITQLRTRFSKELDRVAITASTGLAACNIGGVTLHSYAGIGLGKEAPADLVKKIKRNPKAKNRWFRTKVLIIDEISMVDGELFDKLEAVARQIKNNGRPFGGIQLVITGDFFQLPPVPDNNKIAKFAFEAETWNTSIDYTIGLTQVFRQRDAGFASMLDEMRLGMLAQPTVDAFKLLERPINYEDGIEATELFPTRSEVECANNARMKQLAGKAEVFDAVDGGSTLDIKMRLRLLSSCMAPSRLELKVNAQVMLIKNIDEALVNGSLGRVVGFMNEKTYCLLSGDDGVADFLTAEESDEGETALSKRRARIKAQLALLAGDTSKKWPLVQFILSDGTTRQFLAQPEQWKVELPNGEVQASRTQVPLILAWALSIHKAQGQTLERVKVDLGKVFEKGQAYVALSRATCQEGLQILRFDPKKVMAHEKVRAFYASLYNAMEVNKTTSRARGIKSQEELEFGEDERTSKQAYG